MRCRWQVFVYTELLLAISGLVDSVVGVLLGNSQLSGVRGRLPTESCDLWMAAHPVVSKALPGPCGTVETELHFTRL